MTESVAQFLQYCLKTSLDQRIWSAVSETQFGLDVITAGFSLSLCPHSYLVQVMNMYFFYKNSFLLYT